MVLKTSAEPRLESVNLSLPVMFTRPFQSTSIYCFVPDGIFYHKIWWGEAEELISLWVKADKIFQAQASLIFKWHKFCD